MKRRLTEVVKEAVVILVVVKVLFICAGHLQEGKDIWRGDLDRIVERHCLLLLLMCRHNIVESGNPLRRTLLHKASLSKVVKL